MKKIAVNTVKKFAKAQDSGVLTFSFPIEDSTFEVKFNPNLTLDEKSTFVQRVLHGCFDVGGNYRPEFRQPTIRATILQMCTNVPVIALKKEEGDEGEFMDIDAMNALYLAMRDALMENEQCGAFIREMYEICTQAINWHKEKLIADRNDAMASAINAFGEAATAVRKMADVLMKKAEQTDPEALMNYAETLAKTTEGMDQRGFVRELVQLSTEQSNEA